MNASIFASNSLILHPTFLEELSITFLLVCNSVEGMQIQNFILKSKWHGNLNLPASWTPTELC